MGKYPQSRYVLVVENLAPATRAGDVRYEMEYYGDVRRCERDRGMKMALVEFERYDITPTCCQRQRAYTMYVSLKGQKCSFVAHFYGVMCAAQ